MVDARDYAYLWAWEPIEPEQIAELLSRFARPWWICGGWALDLFLARETRRHADLDVALLRHDQLALFHHLRAWDLHYATPIHTLEPWDGRHLGLPIHGIWARRSGEPNASWTCEFLLNEERDGEWVFRRNEAVRRPLEEIGDERDGVPFLRPEIVLLYKATERSPKNDTDFAAVQPRLSRESSLWLRAALERCDDRHPWIQGLLATGRNSGEPFR
jgi:Aminoglycoside-2''-adenylyltransferase